MDLMDASRQWAERPADERFWNLAEMRAALAARRERCREALVPFEAIRVVPLHETELALVGPTGVPAQFTNWSFKQVCGRSGAPSEYIAGLPSILAANNLNHGLEVRAEDRRDVNLLFDAGNGHPLQVRAFTSDRYDRLWDDLLVDALEALQEGGWRVPPARPTSPDAPGARPATAEDILHDKGQGGGLSVNIGDMIAPAGLYAGDRDSFVFMVNERVRIQDGTEGGLSRGFFITNSEVGAKSFGVTTFLYRHVCGNHIVWDASEVVKIRLRHVGQGIEYRAVRDLERGIAQEMHRSPQEDETRIRAAQRHELGPKQEDVIDALFKKVDLSKKVLVASYERAEYDGENPRTAWGMAQGVTRLSQQQGYADRRTQMDTAAGKILQIAF